MKKTKYSFYEGYEPDWMCKENGNSGLTAADRHRQNKMAMANGQAAEVRSRHPEMEVKRLAPASLL